MRKKAKGAIMISTTISPILWEKAQKSGISWAEAMRIGITSLLSKEGDQTFINAAQQERKIENLALLLSQYSADLEKIRIENEQLKKEVRKNG